MEVVSRVMRHFDRDDVILEEYALLGETVVKVGSILTGKAVSYRTST